jgi:hypothetical protein
MAEAGKGSKPRPFSVSHEEWSTRWDAIFGRDLGEKSDSKDEKESQTQDEKETAEK